MIHHTMSPAAAAALKAARVCANLGRRAGYTYAMRRGCNMGLYRLACQLHAAQNGGVA